MGSTSLYDRLRRLRPDAPPPAALPPEPASPSPRDPESLGRLERALVGSSGEGLGLRERLERLVQATATRRVVAAAPAPVGVPIEELVQGRRVSNERGEFFLVESDVHLDRRHGDLSLSRFRTVSTTTAAILTADPRLASFDLARAAFVDTETTGLAGGTGTAAFLIGVGFVDGDRFRVRQYFMRDYHEEAALLSGLAADLAGRTEIVTFNGATFDLPLLEARYRLCRSRDPLRAMRHLDLLHSARRLWKLRLSTCRLQTLEAALLGFRRQGDVSGEEIPRIYFDFVRRRDGRALARVLEHNRLDVVSLAALAVLAFQCVEGGLADDPRDAYSLGRVFERARLDERSDEQYRRAVVGGAEVRVEALLRLGARASARGAHEEALGFWQRAAEAGDWRALRSLAIAYEHRRRDPRTALAAVDRGLALVGRLPADEARRAFADLHRRRARLARKLARPPLD